MAQSRIKIKIEHIIFFLAKTLYRNTPLISIMTQKYFADIVINKEKLSAGEPVFVAHCSNLGITSQGFTMEDAMINIKEAIALYLEEQPERYAELEANEEPPLFSVVEIIKNGQVASIVR